MVKRHRNRRATFRRQRWAMEKERIYRTPQFQYLVSIANRYVSEMTISHNANV